jgi:hypothetical protein
MRLLLILILWCILLVLCWPLAILVLVAIPVVWLITILLRLLALVFEAVFATLRAVLLLPARLLTWPFQKRQLVQG